MDKRQAILEATLELLAKKGIHDTSVSLIAKHAKVGMGTLYNYFPTKEDLLRTLFHEMVWKRHAFVKEGYDETAPVPEQFRFLWKRAVTHVLEFPTEFLFMDLVFHLPFINMQEPTIQEAVEEPFFQVYAEGQRLRLMKPGNIQHMLYFTAASFTYLAKYHVAGTMTMTAEEIDFFVEAAWDALKQ